MMKALSQLLTAPILKDLRYASMANMFPGITFENAMAFLLTDGIIPASGLPADSFLRLEDWIRDQSKVQSLECFTTELKNETGRIIEAVLRGDDVLNLLAQSANKSLGKPATVKQTPQRA